MKVGDLVRPAPGTILGDREQVAQGERNLRMGMIIDAKNDALGDHVKVFWPRTMRTAWTPPSGLVLESDYETGRPG